MKRWEKTLARLSLKEKGEIKRVLELIRSRNLDDLDLKKLKGYADVYRVRKGDIRIIFRTEDAAVFVIAIERRGDTTYNI